MYHIYAQKSFKILFIFIIYCFCLFRESFLSVSLASSIQYKLDQKSTVYFQSFIFVNFFLYGKLNFFEKEDKYIPIINKDILSNINVKFFLSSVLTIFQAITKLYIYLKYNIVCLTFKDNKTISFQLNLAQCLK